MIRQPANDMATDEPLDLDTIEARANAASEGPWERGDVWSWAGIRPDGKCAYCELGDPVWAGLGDINGKYIPAHKHRDPDPWEPDHLISSASGLVAGNYDYEVGGVLDPANTEFIAHARIDVPALVAEVRRLRASEAVGKGIVEQCSRELDDIRAHLARMRELVDEYAAGPRADAWRALPLIRDAIHDGVS